VRTYSSPRRCSTNAQITDSYAPRKSIVATSFALKTTLTGNALAFDLRPLVALKATLRGNMISSNGYGIQTYDPTGLMTLDLGTAALPGGNTITASTTTGIKLVTAPLQIVSASGNTWNAGVQGADASGHYAAGASATGPVATGTNYQLTSATHLDL